jgi:NAD(P)-dependent dehydrogenase (short-subunit alcohol dehydrogenase family)
LFPYLNHAGARIINVSSIAHSLAKEIDLNDLNSDKDYSGWGAYEQTKMENILFTQELQRRADAAGLDWLTVTSLHPGIVGTDIWRSTPLVAKSSSLVSKLFYYGIRTTEEGANTQIYLATEKASLLAKGQYYDEFGKIKKLEKFARDPVKALGLWEASERFCGVQFKLL